MQKKNQTLRIALAQLNVCVGDVRNNLSQVQAAIREAREQQADLIVFPELVLAGYPPEDLLFRPDFLTQMQAGVETLAAETAGMTVIVGAPLRRGTALQNMACVLRDGQILAEYSKQCLPNYRVFDEKRYFTPGAQSLVVEVAGVKVGILICEDIWEDAPAQAAVAAGAEVLCVLNASPFSYDKQAQRAALLQRQAANNQCPLAYVNLVGGQDELVFDGDSMLLDAAGNIVFRAEAFAAGVFVEEWEIGSICRGVLHTPSALTPLIYKALTTGIRDYVHKNGFFSVLLGLSGGIDSALVLALAVDALGAENVEAVMMPFHYTSGMSLEDAQQQAAWLGVRYRNIPIASVYDSFTRLLAPEFGDRPVDVTEQNLQARIRGVLLMSLSNKLGSLLLSTSNKSESAVGYATLYGDMAGAFSPLKDVYKMQVYALAEYRNTLGQAIPQRVIERPPSAELAQGQVDQDSLPPYEVLDAILRRFIEGDEVLEDIIASGFDAATVRRVVNLVLLSEYKRRQAAPGVRISGRGFGKDWRYPITSAWRKNLPFNPPKE
ncbi:NAD+ synthase (glutamine-hydrolysing) [Thiothrix caldifontis]|uniref:Glutamine-dependent NAD(+) synthetase n=1 Tax=Thiothrix caldifontis TaxID=525918 RepID=A0A1H4BGB6_9GAMM|nr:NAD+ synthase [Thiothrix caldifontis]SEA47171.1 NAD+ synthase (glutamine-hydrolysing) [Thiothrix caldifontis]